MSRIIAIAAPIGGGKTSLAAAIAGRLGDTELIFHDSYEKATREPVDSLENWLKEGADFNAFSLPGLSDDLRRLKQGKTIVDPWTHREVSAKKYILFEMPLGRAHHESARYIDMLLWIDVPLDIALARKIKEYTDEMLKNDKQDSYRAHLQWIDRFVEGYLGVVRDVLIVQKRKVGKDADVLINGQQSIAVMAEEAAKEIRLRFP